MSNFAYLKQAPMFDSFAQLAIEAENTSLVSNTASVTLCRSAAENATKWLYKENPVRLRMPNKVSFNTLIQAPCFRNFVGDILYQRIDFLRRFGNGTAHVFMSANMDTNMLALEQLFEYLKGIARLYYDTDELRALKFDRKSVGKPETDQKLILYVKPKNEALKSSPSLFEHSLAESLHVSLSANSGNKESVQVTSQKILNEETIADAYVEVTPLNLSEAKTRKLYIDTALADLGWTKNKDWLEEVEITDMPNQAGKGFVDYLLVDRGRKPLAIIEAKKTSQDIAAGRHQASLYADSLEKKYGYRPVIFLTNGYVISINDGIYPERTIYGFYTRQDLEKWFNLKLSRQGLNTKITINNQIVDRYYQHQAVQNVLEEFLKQKRRKCLLTMATGSGKTRTVVALCDVLSRLGWIKRVLFLADRTALVVQAKRAFVNNYPNAVAINLCENHDPSDYIRGNCYFSTYQTLLNLIGNTAKDENGDNQSLFSSGFFDIVICDEAHRSIYNKFQSVFKHFDSLLVGLTATPKNDIDKNTFKVFGQNDGEPSYAYNLEDAVKDGYLVSYRCANTTVKFVSVGISYDDLSDEDKADFENTFADEEILNSRYVKADKINKQVFNKDTIRQVLNLLMTKGLRVDFGNNIGKTIIFARNHRHAEEILKVFNEEYPSLTGYAEVIDNKINYTQDLIDKFSEEDKLPRIAISVDMLDTGVDVPSILNLVFFKPVFSKAKFLQMIGRGTRLCSGLINGEDKKEFYIFDICSNFDFFRSNPKGIDAPLQISLQSSLFRLKLDLVFKLQDEAYQTDELVIFRKELVDSLVKKTQELDRHNFEVKQHIKWVDFCCDAKNYLSLDEHTVKQIKEEVMPLVLPDKVDVRILRFDALLHGIELAQIAKKKFAKARKDLNDKMDGLAKLSGAIKEIKNRMGTIDRVRSKSFIEDASLNELEEVRKELRDLMTYLGKKTGPIYVTDFTDEILSESWEDAELSTLDTVSYKEKVRTYIAEHSDNPVVAKIKANVPLSAVDVTDLERLLWEELGDKETYHKEVGDKDLGLFIRGLTGLDMHAAKEAFARFLDESTFNARQISFINLLINYIAKNGFVSDFTILMEEPFASLGSISNLYGNNLEVFKDIKMTIQKVKDNAVTGVTA